MARAALTMFSALTALFTGSGCTATAQDLDAARQRMVDTQLRAEGISSGAVLAAMARVPGTCSCRRSFASAPTTTRPYPSASVKPFAAVHRRVHDEMLQLREHTVLEIGRGRATRPQSGGAGA